MSLQVLFGKPTIVDGSGKGVDQDVEAVDALEAQLEQEMASKIGATVDLSDDAGAAELLAMPSVEQQAQLDELQAETGEEAANIWQIAGALCRVPKECLVLASTCSAEQLLREFELLPRQCLGMTQISSSNVVWSVFLFSFLLQAAHCLLVCAHV